MANITDRIRRLFERNDAIEVRKIGASRAVYIDPDRSEIEIKIEIETGDTLILRLPPRLAHKLITEVSTAYHAINPPLHGGMGSAGFYGMGEG